MANEKLISDYPGLLIISMILKVIGIIHILISIILFISGLALLGNNVNDNEQLSVYLILGAVFLLLFSIPVFASSELIKLFIRIEYNTRKEKNDNQVVQSESTFDEKKSDTTTITEFSFKEWAKENPNKTLNDYLASISKKSNC